VRYFRTGSARVELRKRFLFESEIAKRGIPSVASVWSIPEWLSTIAERRSGQRPPHARSRWPEFLEMTASYLQHLKTVYHAEPEYFSFNEPDMGIASTQRRRPCGVEHPAGPRFEAMDMKTRPSSAMSPMRPPSSTPGRLADKAARMRSAP